MTPGKGLRPLRATVIVPCYNEASRIDTAAFRAYLESSSAGHLIFVDDGSTDATFAALEAICAGAGCRAQVLRLASNSGKAEAVRFGVMHALEHVEQDVVGFWDADLATPVDAIARLLAVLEARSDIAMVFGSRVKLLGRCVERRAARHYLGRVFATAVSTMLHLPIYDTQCGAKLFRADAQAHSVFARPFLSKWVFDVEIIARYLNMNGNDPKRLAEMIYEYPLETWTDIAGSKVRPNDFLAAGLDLARIRNAYLADLKEK